MKGYEMTEHAEILQELKTCLADMKDIKERIKHLEGKIIRHEETYDEFIKPREWKHPHPWEGPRAWEGPSDHES